jgi:hypothetical protein
MAKKVTNSAKKVTLKPKKKDEKPITFKSGGLHRSTKTPAKKKIPASKMRAALSGKLGPKAKRQAQLKQNVLTGPKKK